MRISERLVALAGGGGQVQALLASIGPGATVSERIVSYSGLSSATVEAHLLYVRSPGGIGGGEVWTGWMSPMPTDYQRRRERDDADALVLMGIL